MWDLHMPLAWLLGAMIATGAAALFRLPVSMPAFARPPMTAAIGAMLGTSFSPTIFEHAGAWLVSLGGLSVFIAAAGALVYIYFRLVAGFDPPTVYFSAMPGGLVEMVTLGMVRGGDEMMIALTHAARPQRSRLRPAREYPPRGCLVVLRGDYHRCGCRDVAGPDGALSARSHDCECRHARHWYHDFRVAKYRTGYS
ncbi:hypothetical protein GOC56_31235 [Sinorhizobium meliloti]|nr:hypothetical protein [Sinorhizobium meliloti]MDW9515446.1 hypothetical protein [Sinorhizobium meliloti]MDX0378262.1 hypothetical protein [Sinorhizobium meliloti]